MKMTRNGKARRPKNERVNESYSLRIINFKSDTKAPKPYLKGSFLYKQNLVFQTEATFFAYEKRCVEETRLEVRVL